MDQNKTVPSKDRKMEPPKVVTDASRFNEPTYEYYSNEDNNVVNDNPSQLPSTSGDSNQGTPRSQDPSYDMSGNKILYIFNHYMYEKWRHSSQRPSVRSGTYKDVHSLENTFRCQDFEIYPYNDMTHKEILQNLTHLCEMDHSKTSCVAVAVMTHGLGNHLCAADTLYPVTDITTKLQNTPGLANKPKLFFIQACREKHIRTKQHDKVDMTVGADSVLLYSTYEDYVAYRNMAGGSWFIQALCEVIDKYHSSEHFAKMITRINGKVAENGVLTGKQMSVAEFNLKKFLMLRRLDE